ncbi:MAG: beta-lactamase family protein [Haliscomenobacter sp.]|nr:beta-lactamase family protein [Haliscomenobacter sp.]
MRLISWSSPKLLLAALFSFFLLVPGYSQTIRLDSARVASFMDGMMAAQLKNKHLAGASVAIVQNGKLLFAKGYGYADLERKTPVDPGKTLFRIGSISKTFIWTSVMQLVQQGKLDLNADINTYCKDFQIPANFPQPVTLLDLMNHNPGFEDRVLGLFAKSPESLKPLGEILREEMPRRVWAPGTISAYSNHGSGMAAYIVEQASGLSWDDYVEKHILQPLHMNHTTFRQPVPEALASGLSKGYTWQNGRFQSGDFEYVPLAPVGAASATAKDMARFMIAHLQYGKLDTVRILDSLTAREMYRPSFRHTPDMNPMRHGFMDISRYGQEIFGHGGDTELFHALMALFPAHQIGVFVSFNSAEGSEAYQKVMEAFVEYFFPEPVLSNLKPDARQAEALKKFEGAYRANRFTRSDLTKIVALMSPPVEVVVTPEGYLETRAPGQTRRWIQEGKLLFREDTSPERIAFRVDDSGQITHMFLSEMPIFALERTPVLDLPGVNTGLFGMSLGILLLALIGWPMGALARRRYGIRAVKANLLPASARWIAWLAALAMVIYLAGVAMQVKGAETVLYGLSPQLKTWLFLPWGIGVLSLGVLWHTLLIWGNGRGRMGARLGYTLVFLALAALFWLLVHWQFFPRL